MSQGRVFLPLLMVAAGVLAAVGCTKKPAQKAEAGQVAAAPLATPATEPGTEDGCRACNGVWGTHGLDQTVRCVCRTKDAGKKCRGKDECEGECIGDAGDKEVTQTGPPPLGFWIGKCAEMRTTFGCHTFLPPKPTQPVRLDQAPEQMCVD